MEEVQTIVALGAGTVTKRVYGDGRIERCDNVKDVKLYMEKIEREREYCSRQQNASILLYDRLKSLLPCVHKLIHGSIFDSYRRRFSVTLHIIMDA